MPYDQRPLTSCKWVARIRHHYLSSSSKQEPYKLIHALLGYVLAPNEASLGFDTSIRSIAPGEIGHADARSETSFSYEINIDNSTGETIAFHTTACLTDRGAVEICGGGTRIWEVSKVGDEDEGCLYLMKDTWVDLDRPTEGDWLRVIHTEGQPEDLQYFLKPAYDCPVLTQDWRGEYCQDNTLSISVEPNIPDEEADEESDGESDEETRALWRHKKHYRIVFSELDGIPIHSLITYGDAFTALHGALKGKRFQAPESCH